jgi:hypothetical protein
MGRRASSVVAETIVVDVARRCERYLTERRVWEGLDDDLQETLPELQAASIEGRSAVTGGRAKRVQQLGGRTFELPPRCATFQGYNLHGNVCIGARDRRGLERLCRYVLRPPLGQERLSREPGGRVRWTLKRPWSDGTTALLFSPAELVERLAALVPPPRANTVLYHGVLAANAKDRGRLLPRPRPRGRRRRAAVRLVRPEDRSEASRWAPWSWLLHRVFGRDPMLCPHCGSRMQLRAVVLGRPATTRVLEGLAVATRARAPP